MFDHQSLIRYAHTHTHTHTHTHPHPLPHTHTHTYTHTHTAHTHTHTPHTHTHTHLWDLLTPNCLAKWNWTGVTGHPPKNTVPVSGASSSARREGQSWRPQTKVIPCVSASGRMTVLTIHGLGNSGPNAFKIQVMKKVDEETQEHTVSEEQNQDDSTPAEKWTRW